MQEQPVSPAVATFEVTSANTPPGSLMVNNTELVVMHQERLWLLDVPASVAPLLAAKNVTSAALLLPERLRLEPAEVNLLTARAGLLCQMGFDVVLSNQVLIIRAVPQLLQGTPLSHVLPMWWSGWPAQTELTLLWQQLLQLLLSRQLLSLHLLLQTEAGLLQQPEHWCAVPVDLTGARRQLQEKTQ
ncbi:MAG: hypothetical protein U5L02_20115 [Rheinheimera sp.]|nr:hypothetical protein [Rheinheimera sp.]